MDRNDYAKAAADALKAAIDLLAIAETNTRVAGMNVTCRIVQDAARNLQAAHEHAATWSEPQASI